MNEQREKLTNVILQYLQPGSYQKDTPARTRAENIAYHLYSMGYRLFDPAKLTLLDLWGSEDMDVLDYASAKVGAIRQLAHDVQTMKEG